MQKDNFLKDFEKKFVHFESKILFLQKIDKKL